MHLLRPAPLVFGLAVAFFSHTAAAGTAMLPLPLGTPDASNLYGLELNQWFVLNNQISAATMIQGAITQDGTALAFPTGDDLTRRASTSQSSGSRFASAVAQLSPTSLGTLASAHDPMNAFSTGTFAMGYSSIVFAAVLDRDTSVNFNIKLDGYLNAGDQHQLNSDLHGAAVAALAFGSTANYKTEDMLTAFHTAGLDPYAEDEAFIRQYSTLQSTTQTHLDTFGAQTSIVKDWVDVNTSLNVTAEGTRLDCDPSLSPACGRYFYFFEVMLFTAAQDGGLADFSHTLKVSSYSVDNGSALPFNAVSAVPEPSAALLMAAGLCGLGLRRRLRR